MASMVERDPGPMNQFATEILEYSDKMRKVCDDLKSNMDTARPVMRDEASQKAFQKIEAFADNLIASLPEAQCAAEKLQESAKFLEQALRIDI